MVLNASRCFLMLVTLGSVIIDVAAQQSKAGGTDDALPKEVRGYKVQRAPGKIKKAKGSENEMLFEGEEEIVHFGEARIVNLSPLGITFDVSVIVAAVKQRGDVDQLVFDGMRVNDTPVTVEDYTDPFALPNEQPLTLAHPVRVSVTSPQVVLTSIDEWLNSKDVWPVTGRVYVCGHFKKSVLTFKRAVAVELHASIDNPSRQR
jgi:hypothetical protein